MVKRINFNMNDECHALLKSVCALKCVSLKDYVYGLVRKDFENLVMNDPQVYDIFMSQDYPTGSNAAALKLKVKTSMSKDN